MNFMSGRAGFYEETCSSSRHPLHQESAVDVSHDHMLVRSSVEREHMFDKVVTPSDVGKLNRLVIPKQHAEKYFPLDSSTNDKGLLLNFEDKNGKEWRFRYSYWNSSQSYVMTKGWSRFVKDKKLDAGDTVSFQRGVGHLLRHHLFIDWRRRPDAQELRPLRNPCPPAGSITYLMRSGHVPMVFESVPVVRPKRLRLFGVTMDCPISDHSSDQCHTQLQKKGGFPISSSRSDYKGSKRSMSLDLDI